MISGNKQVRNPCFRENAGHAGVDLFATLSESQVSGEKKQVDRFFLGRPQCPVQIPPNIDIVRVGFLDIQMDIAELSDSHSLSMTLRGVLFNPSERPYTLPRMSTLLYLDSTMIVVAKTSGQPVQSRSRQVETLIAEWRRKLDEPLQAVHRIDQRVSGLVVLARSRSAAAYLFERFRDKSVRRWYLAVVDAEPPEAEGELVDFIQVDHGSNRSVIRSTGKESRLFYRQIGRTEHHWVLLVTLDTGRHHQIRVQLAARGMHVLGDTKYGARRPMRDRSIALHAWRMAIPSQWCARPVVLSAPVPDGSLWRSVSTLLPGEVDFDRVDH